MRLTSTLAALSVCWVSLWLLIAPAAAEEKEGNTNAPAAAGPGGQSAEEQIQRALDEKASLSLKETPLHDFAELLREKTGLNVLIDRKALEDVGIADDAPVSGELREISLRSILNILLGRLDLSWTVENGALVITTPEATEDRLAIQVYNVRDLIAMDAGEDDRYDADQLIEVITSIVRPDAWAAVGGPGSIQPYGETLAISQVGEIHREIAALLEALRKAQRMSAEDPQASPKQISILAGDEGDSRILDAMKQPISLALNDTPLSELPPLLGDQIGIQGIIDPRALENVGITADEIVLTISVKNLPASAALAHILKPRDLTWIVKDEVLHITTPEEPEWDLRVYPVADLCDFSLKGELFLQPGGRGPEELMETITYTVESDTWDEVGGPGAIEPLASAGALVISQTAVIHAKIEDLLVQLRKKLSEEQDTPAGAKADPNALQLVVYDLPQPAPQIPAQQPAHDGNVQQPAAPGGGLFQFGGGFGLGVGPPIPGDDLVEIVTSLVEPDSWNREGAYIKAVAGRLIVRNTAAVHRQVKALLVKLGLRSPWDQGGFGGSPIPVVGRR